MPRTPFATKIMSQLFLKASTEAKQKKISERRENSNYFVNVKTKINPTKSADTKLKTEVA